RVALRVQAGQQAVKLAEQDGLGREGHAGARFTAGQPAQQRPGLGGGQPPRPRVPVSHPPPVVGVPPAPRHPAGAHPRGGPPPAPEPPRRMSRPRGRTAPTTSPCTTRRGTSYPKPVDTSACSSGTPVLQRSATSLGPACSQAPPPSVAVNTSP